MKTATAIKAVQKWGRKGTKAYELVMNALENGKNTIRPCWVSGSGRYIKNVDYTYAVTYLLSDAKIKYTLTNDAPRGGLTGNLITLTHIKL